MTWTYLITLIVCSVALAIGQEFLYRQSKKRSGLLRFESAQDVSRWQVSDRFLCTTHR